MNELLVGPFFPTVVIESFSFSFSFSALFFTSLVSGSVLYLNLNVALVLRWFTSLLKN